MTETPCPAVNPVGPPVACQEPAGHEPPHHAVVVDPDGAWEATWFDIEYIKELLRRGR